jgi:hypothetical protein
VHRPRRCVVRELLDGGGNPPPGRGAVMIVVSAIPDAEFRPIQTIDGHLALFGADPNAISQLDKHLGELLATKI